MVFTPHLSKGITSDVSPLAAPGLEIRTHLELAMLERVKGSYSSNINRGEDVSKEGSQQHVD